MAGIIRAFAKTDFEYHKVVCRTSLREHRRALALALRQSDQLFLDPVEFLYLLLGHNRSLVAKYGSRIPWSPRCQNALDFGLGNGRLRITLLDKVHSVPDGSAVLLASSTCLIVGTHDARGTREL